MDKRQASRNPGDSQANENLVFSFPGFKTATQPLLQPNLVPMAQVFPPPGQLYPGFSADQSYPGHALAAAGANNQNVAGHNFRATPDRPVHPPTLGQMASRIKEKASASRRQSSEEMDGVNGAGGGDEGDDGEGDDDDGDDDNAGLNGQDQSTGRWTKKEHELFLAALKKYGKEWKKVAQMVKTRTVVQTRTHAQKYFQKLSKSSGNEFSMDDDAPLPPSTSVSANPSTQKTSTSKRARRSVSPQDTEDYPMSYPGHHTNTTNNNNNTHNHRTNNNNTYNNGNDGNEEDEDGNDDDDIIMKPMSADYAAAIAAAAINSNNSNGNNIPAVFNNNNNNNHILTINSGALLAPPNNHHTNTVTSPVLNPHYLKRKHGELKNAQMLVASSGANAVLDFEGAQVLSSLRQDTNATSTSSSHLGDATNNTSASNANNNYNSNTNSTKGGMRKVRPIGLSLSIVNPANTTIATGGGSSSSSYYYDNDYDNDSSNSGSSSNRFTSEPGTPWDSQIRALHARIQPHSFTPNNHMNHNSNNNNSSQSNLFGSYQYQHISVSTPAEQKQFIVKIQKCIRNGDVLSLKNLLEAATSSNNAYNNNTGHNNDMNNSSNNNNAAETKTDNKEEEENEEEEEGNDEDTMTNTNTNTNLNTSTSITAAANHGGSNSSFYYPFPSPDRRSQQFPVNNAITRTLKQCQLPLLVEAIGLDLSVFNADIIFNIVKLLLDYGVSVTPTDRLTQNNALHVAAQQGLDRVGNLLLSNNNNSNYYYAANHDSSNNVVGHNSNHNNNHNNNCMIEMINVLNKDGNAAVHLAAIAGHGVFLEMLASHGANFHLRNAAALSPIDLAAYASKDPGEREVLRRLMLTVETRLRTTVLYHPDFLAHGTRTPSDWEGPDRLFNVLNRLRDRKEFPAYELDISDAFDKADVTLLGRVHSAEYLAFVNELHKQVQAIAQQQQQLDDADTTASSSSSSFNFFNKLNSLSYDEDDQQLHPNSSHNHNNNNTRHKHTHSSSQNNNHNNNTNHAKNKLLPLPFTPQVQRHVQRQHVHNLKASDSCDTSFSLGTLLAARRAAGAVSHAVDLVLTGRSRNVFCAVRPPGHHSGYNGLLNNANSCGFCIFNNVAAGAFHALEEHKCERVAILDLDIHHGNGTEDIVKRYPHPSRLFFFSVHLYDHEPSLGYHFYPGTGERNDYMHNIINVPIQPLWRNPQKYPEFASPIAAAVKNSGASGSKHSASSSSSTSSSSAAKNSSSVPQNSNTSSTTPANANNNANSAEKTPAVKAEQSTANTEQTPADHNNNNNKTPASSSSSNAENDNSQEEKQLYGREAYRHAITHRLLPTLRAFHPDLILLSMGFDAAKGDVGNCRHVPSSHYNTTNSSNNSTNNNTNNNSTNNNSSSTNSTNNNSTNGTNYHNSMLPVAGMDLLPEDFAWATTEILKIADICCGGRVVSVLEGGYGEYDPAHHHHNSGPHHVVNKTYATRHRTAQQSTNTTTAANTNNNNTAITTANNTTANNTNNSVDIDAHAVQTNMNRSRLADGVAAHVHRLIDPYGPLRISKHRESFHPYNN